MLRRRRIVGPRRTISNGQRNGNVTDIRKGAADDGKVGTRNGKGKKIGREISTNHRDTLNAEHERIRSQVPRVGQRVLPPELREEVLGGRDGIMVEDEVSYTKAISPSPPVPPSSAVIMAV
jgi:hypothetical protein